MTNSPNSCSVRSASINSTLTTNIVCRKRKRTEKTVRFDIEHTVIIDTYSRLDYDRGSTFPFPVQYKINPNISANIPKGPLLSLDIPSSPCDSEASSPDLEQSLILSPTTTNVNKKKRPKLTVDTSICSGEGPLFFTKLSTNHAKHSISESEIDTSNDYLIPVTTPTTPS